MGFLKNLFKKEEHEITSEDMEKVEKLISTKSFEGDDEIIEIKDDGSISKEEEIKSQKKINYEEILKNVKLEDINKIRNFLDKKENEFSNPQNKEEIKVNNQVKNNESIKEEESLVQEIPIEEKIKEEPEKILTENNEELIGGSNSDSIGEKKIEDHITEKELDDKTYENDESVKKDVIEENKEMKFEETQDYSKVDVKEIYDIDREEKEESKNKSLEMLNKIKNIFGEENVLFKENKKSTYENLNYRNLQFIGIRKVDEFKNELSHWAEENSWFVSNIKKLDELKQFKILESKEGIKDLLFDIDGENSIILSFRTTDKLKDENTFDFPILEEE